MGKRSVVLLSNRSLLAVGVGALLQQADHIDLVILPLDDPTWPRRLLTIAPRVVVLDASDQRSMQALVTPILGDLPNCEVVALNFEQPDLQVYYTRRVVVRTARELINLVQDARFGQAEDGAAQA